MSAEISGLLMQLLRATVFLSLSAVITAAVIRLAKPTSPLLQRKLWFLVLIAGLLVFPISIPIPWYDIQPQSTAEKSASGETFIKGDSHSGLSAVDLPTNALPIAESKKALDKQIISGDSIKSLAAVTTTFAAFKLHRPEVLFGVWLAGIIIILILNFITLLRNFRLIGNCRAPEEEWQSQWMQILAAHKIRRLIPLVMTVNLGPALHLLPNGYRLLLPCALWTKLTATERRTILLHELCHWRHGDVWKLFLARLLVLPHWYNPLGWWTLRRFNECTEWACDDAAVGAVREEGLIFARTLLKLGSDKQLQSLYGATAHGGRLYQRIRRLISPNSATDSIWKKTILFATVSAILIFGAIRLELVAKEPAQTAAAGQKSVGGANTPSATDTNPNDPAPILLSAFGTVVDESDKPVSGATVYLREWSTYRISENFDDGNPQDILATTQTDAQGGFSFKDIRAKSFNVEWTRDNPWDVVVLHEGHALAWEHLGTAKRLRPMRFELQKEAQITGHVIDEQNHPIQGIEVTVFDIAPIGSHIRGNHGEIGRLDLQSSQLSSRSKTDSEGNVTIKNLPKNVRLNLVLDHEEYRRNGIYVATTDQPQPELEDLLGSLDGKESVKMHKIFSNAFNVTMKAPVLRIVGRVTAADSGKPIVEARVYAYLKNGANRAFTDESGRFVIKDFTNYKFDLEVSPKDKNYLSYREPMEISQDKKLIEVNVKLPRGQVISGQVVAKDTDKGVAGVSLYFSPNADKDKFPEIKYLANYAETDIDGRFQIVVPAQKGKLVISGAAKGFDIPSSVQTLKNGDPSLCKEIDVQPSKPEQNIKFTLTPIKPGEGPPPRGNQTVIPKIEGKVVDSNGAPVADAEVGMSSWFRMFNENDTLRITHTDQQGRFILRNIPIDNRLNDFNFIRVVHKDRKLCGRIYLEESLKSINAQNPLEIRLGPTGAITGRVMEGETPIANATVQLDERRDPKGLIASESISRWSDSTKTDEQGQFSFPMVEAGKEYHVDAFLEGYVQAADEIHQAFPVKTGETVELKPFKLLRANMTVAGTVVDPDGKPIEGVEVSVDYRNGHPIERAFTRRPTAKDGRFFINNLPNAPLTITAYIRPADDSKDQSIYYPANVKAEPGDQDIRILLHPRTGQSKSKK